MNEHATIADRGHPPVRDASLVFRLSHGAPSGGLLALNLKLCMMEMGMEYELWDLRAKPDERVFDRFVALYQRYFTRPEITEPPERWRRRLWPAEAARPELPQIDFHIIAAGIDFDKESPGVYGGLVFEYYPASSTGLLTYLVVDESCRMRGIARRLNNAAALVLQADAEKRGQNLRAIFAETDDPRHPAFKDKINTIADKLVTLSRLGAKWIDIPYVQPPLGPDRPWVDSMILLAFPDLMPTRAGSVAGKVVREFLYELYRVLDVADPENDPHFRKVIPHLTDEVAFKEIPKAV